jgi:hypothetical protein
MYSNGKGEILFAFDTKESTGNGEVAATANGQVLRQAL